MDLWYLFMELAMLLAGAFLLGALAERLRQSAILGFDGSFKTYGNNLDIYVAKAQPKEWRTFSASGACILITKQLFDAIGEFDEILFLINDDVDLSWRVRLLGYGVGCAKESICYHFGNYATEGQIPRMVYFQQRNRIRILLKNYSPWSIFKRLGIVLGLVLLFGTYFALVNRNPCYLKAVLMAFLWNIGHIGDTLRARKRVQRLRNVPDSEVEKHMIPYASEFYSFGVKIGLVKKPDIPYS